MRSSHSTASQRVYQLRNAYLTKAVILEGLSKEAQEQNAELLLALKKAGEILNREMPNVIYGAFMQGSRIKGYHTADSDLDLVLVTTEQAKTEARQSAVQTILNVLKEQGLTTINWDPMSGAWVGLIDVEHFELKVDNECSYLNTMFGYEVWGNSNLFLARLAALRIVVDGYRGEFPYWDDVKMQYNSDYLGNREHDLPKIAERVELPLAQVTRILSADIYDKRFRKFTLPSPRTLYKELKKWYREIDKESLRQYDMLDVYADIQRQIRST